ncbi:nucleoside 2-deoxyribosyltransferase [Acetobacteraceae bacterium]|nr:nucleoside 2-deoxyribosyltransferase [Candidatus Parcubacteria bacterium]
MNIFFIGSIRGGRADQPRYARIVKILEQYGSVFSHHVSDETLSQYGETELSGKEILERELETLAKNDAIVAEVTTPSLGVGYLIARATSLEKKVIALYCGDDALKLSAIIKGDPRVEVHTYKADEEIENLLVEIFNKEKAS